MIRDSKARADVEDNFRKTIGQLIGGAAVLIGAGLGTSFAYLQFSQQQKASHELLISNQVSKGFEQLGSKKDVVRLGGIYALEGAMNTSEQYHGPILEALSAFVRDRTSTKTGDGPPATDVQAALTVMGRRVEIEGRVPDLANAQIPKAELSGANLSHALLYQANLSGADLDLANLSDASLYKANLSGARLSKAHLKYAELGGANLSGALLADAYLISTGLSGADLSNANVKGAILTHADLKGANLSGADLTGANLSGADLKGANLSGADLGNPDWVYLVGGADLTGAIVSQTQLDDACGTNVKLPPGLSLKPCNSLK